MMGYGSYVLGLEPANAYVEGRAAAGYNWRFKANSSISSGNGQGNPLAANRWRMLCTPPLDIPQISPIVAKLFPSSKCNRSTSR